MHPLFSAMNMNINNVNNYNNVRERSHSLSNTLSRSTYVISKASSILYHKKIVINNNLPNEEFVELINSSQLSYNSNGQERNYISMATNLILFQGPQCVSNKTSALNTCNVPHVSDNNIINI